MRLCPATPASFHALKWLQWRHQWTVCCPNSLMLTRKWTSVLIWSNLIKSRSFAQFYNVFLQWEAGSKCVHTEPSRRHHHGDKETNSAVCGALVKTLCMVIDNLRCLVKVGQGHFIPFRQPVNNEWVALGSLGTYQTSSSIWEADLNNAWTVHCCQLFKCNRQLLRAEHDSARTSWIQAEQAFGLLWPVFIL